MSNISKMNKNEALNYLIKAAKLQEKLLNKLAESSRVDSVPAKKEEPKFGTEQDRFYQDLIDTVWKNKILQIELQDSVFSSGDKKSPICMIKYVKSPDGKPTINFYFLSLRHTPKNPNDMDIYQTPEKRISYVKSIIGKNYNVNAVSRTNYHPDNNAYSLLVTASPIK